MGTSVVSGRVEDATRHKADLAIRKAGLTANSVIQNLWASIAESGEVPQAAQPGGGDAGKQAALERLDAFLAKLPPVNSEYEGWSDNEILALQVDDHA